MSLLKKSPIQSLFICKRRHMTEAEKQLAFSVFGNALHMDDVEIVAHRFVLRHYAISPNGNIYFNEKDWCEDFSKRPLNEQSWLIHELTHVWQIQQGIAVIRKAILDRRYNYVIEQGKHFLNYGVEQQAQMVQDYFTRSQQKQACEDLKACIPFLAKPSFDAFGKADK